MFVTQIYRVQYIRGVASVKSTTVMGINNEMTDLFHILIYGKHTKPVNEIMAPGTIYLAHSHWLRD